MKTAKMPKPKKPKLPAIASNEQLHSTVDEVAELEVEYRRLVAARDAEMQDVMRRHDGPIEAIKVRIAALTKLSGIYSGANRQTLFGTLKSAASRLSTFGFRMGNPSLCTLNKQWTWEKILASVKAAGRNDFIRTSEELDKDAVKNAGLTDAQLAALGMRIDQGEKFYVESKAEGANRITAGTEDEAAA